MDPCLSTRQLSLDEKAKLLQFGPDVCTHCKDMVYILTCSINTCLDTKDLEDHLDEIAEDRVNCRKIVNDEIKERCRRFFEISKSLEKAEEDAEECKDRMKETFRRLCAV